MWRANVPFVSVGKHYEADAASVWNLITDTFAWTEWGPTVSDVECGDRFIKPGSRGRVKTSLGLWLPFRITEFSNGSSWSWRVGHVSATRHRIVHHPEGGCDLWFDTPILAAPYSVVCRIALGRIEKLLSVAEQG